MRNLNDILKSLTLEEKCALISGVTNWATAPIKDKNIPTAIMADGPHGLRKEQVKIDVANIMQESVPATCFPTAVTVASSWDVGLANKMGEAISEECIDQGVDVVLGPGVNIKRNPLCGRNFEYYSEDPLLAGEMGAAFVNGVQKSGIGTSLKHYAVNSQEYRRMTVSSEVDERALREIYLPAFETVVKKANPYTIMCSYNPINGVYASDNKKLLTDILRDEWGFKGIVVSDWGAVNDRIQGIRAGLDLEMPTSNGLRDAEVFAAVKNGELSEEELDKCVLRMLDYIFKCFDARNINNGKKADYEKNFALAQEIAEKSAVLLKNDGILPLKKDTKIAVIGDLAKTMRYQGSGSSRINPAKLTSFVDYLKEINAEYSFAAGYDPNDSGVSEKLIKEAVWTSKNAETVLLFVGLTDIFESESFDRKHMELPEAHVKLIDAVAAVNKNIVVVLSGGSAMSMPWLNKTRAVLNMYLAGCAGGRAAHRIIYGKVNPSGKLAETFPLNMQDNPAYLYFGMGPQTVEYRESIYVGYRYFDKAKKNVLFPFGFGLSYTKFEYSDLKLSSQNISCEEDLTVSFKIKNVGNMKGEEIAQVYVKDVESTVFREEKALKGFVKVALEIGESKTVKVTLDKRSFAFYDVTESDWKVESGDFEIMVGASVADIRLNAAVKVSGDGIGTDYRESAPCYYDICKLPEIPAKDFEVLLGRKLKENFKPQKGEIDYNTTFDDIGVICFGKLLRRIIIKFSSMIVPKGSPEFVKEMIREGAKSMPLRNAFAMTNGMVPKESVDAFITRCNKGFGSAHPIITAFKAKKQPKKSDLYPIK